MRPLNQTTLSGLGDLTAVPTYDRDNIRAGIAHLSVGNFHRAHQAVFIDRCLALPGQEGWGILGIGVQETPAERVKADGLRRQDGLYTLTLFPPRGAPSTAVIGSIVGYLVAPDDPGAVLDRLTEAEIRIVSLTITEGGYNIDERTGDFRLDAPAIVHDLAHPETPRTVFGLITEALRRRRRAGTPAFTVLSCDNLRHNGDVLRKGILAFAGAIDPTLAAWIGAEASFPNSMVDRITPAVTAADRERLNAQTGIDDAVPIFAEDFIQWVIEDRFPTGRPALEKAGVIFTSDVAAYEQVKLRMLNATHSMLSYPGLLLGHRLVHEAMADPRILNYLRCFLDHDVIPLLEAPPGMSLEAYRDSVLDRFANPAIADQLERITSDGAAKIPVFLGDTLAAILKQDGDCRRLAFLLAAYVTYLGGQDEKGRPFRADEPHLTAGDRDLIAASDPCQALRIDPFKGLYVTPVLEAAFRLYRQRLQEGAADRCLRELLQPA
ncbi:mannitol 2-dehydrogenase/sorbose reductase [Arboricoccus pini]|uniref:Mannitol 2-dehydrogenase/sorbose reductase n=1 Tax=Arboricoccus pini TaxID=1963835 RepID=A0A212RIB8_9PROT|nr:mannitol dehydrogenase family protein [Arboricoccus pini]SNB72191.1 mannitol 2-dehydrogenase/sorbose reductase [Arboricoccus pini]